MDAITYLRNNEDTIAHRLSLTVKHYADWTQDRVFEESKKCFSGLAEHFKKESMVWNTVRGLQNDLDEVVQQAENQAEEIESEVGRLVMIHVDEPGFEQGLEEIASKFEEHRAFCDKELFPKVKKEISQKNMQRVNAQLEQVILD